MGTVCHQKIAVAIKHHPPGSGQTHLPNAVIFSIGDVSVVVENLKLEKSQTYDAKWQDNNSGNEVAPPDKESRQLLIHALLGIKGSR